MQNAAFTDSRLTELIKDGIKQSRETDFQQGFVHGFKQGFLEGFEIQTLRNSILDLLSIRFEGISRTLIQKINLVDTVIVLKSLFQQAATTESIPAFEESLDKIVGRDDEWS